MDNANYDALNKRVAKLEDAIFGNSARHTHIAEGVLDWSLNERAFVSRYAVSMTGGEKFVLLMAYIAKGDTDKPVALHDIEKLWGKMTSKSLLGMKFNRKYTSDAKTKGWVDSPQSGAYQLTYGWVEIIKEEEEK